MRIAGDQPSIYDHPFNKYRDTAVDAWTEHGCHCSCRGASVMLCKHDAMDSPFVHCPEKEEYDQPLG